MAGWHPLLPGYKFPNLSQRFHIMPMYQLIFWLMKLLMSFGCLLSATQNNQELLQGFRKDEKETYERLSGWCSYHSVSRVKEVRRRELKAVVAGIPKTIDNGIPESVEWVHFKNFVAQTGQNDVYNVITSGPVNVVVDNQSVGFIFGAVAFLYTFTITRNGWKILHVLMLPLQVTRKEHDKRVTQQYSQATKQRFWNVLMLTPLKICSPSTVRSKSHHSTQLKGKHTQIVVATMPCVWCRFLIRRSEPHFSMKNGFYERIMVHDVVTQLSPSSSDHEGRIIQPQLTHGVIQ